METIEKNKAPATSISDVKRFELMAVNDSFLENAGKRQSLMTTASVYFHRQGRKVFKSTVKDQPKGKVRFWRHK